MTMFASLDQLALRLGSESEDDLTPLQVAQGSMLLTLVTALITENAGHDDEWAAALDPIPAIYTAVALEAVAAVMQNPGGARSESEQLGAYSHSTSFTDGAHSLTIEPWLKLLNAALNGNRSRTFMPGITTDLLIELRDTGEIAEFPAT